MTDIARELRDDYPAVDVTTVVFSRDFAGVGCCVIPQDRVMAVIGALETMSDLLRIIARGVEIGQSGRPRDLNRGDMQRLARQYCDDNKLSYAVKDLRVEERVGFLNAEKET